MKRDNESINLLYLIDNLKIGGAQKIVKILSHRLPAEKYNVCVICLGDTEPLYQSFKDDHIKIFSFNMVFPWQLLKLGKLIGFINRNNITILHTFLSNSNIIGRFLGKICRVPVTVCSERATGVWKSRIRSYVEQLTNGSVNYFTAVSENTRRYMIEKENILPEKIITIYNGVHVQKSNHPPNAITLRRELGIPDNVIVAGSVGRLVDQKGYKYLIEAFREVSNKLTNVILLIVGSGPLEDTLKKMTDEYNLSSKVIFTGLRDDVNMLLEVLDIYVVSSLFEGVSNALLEAMANGLPVVATAVDGNAEVVIDGETGYLVPPGNSNALAKALLKMIGSPEDVKKMGISSRKRIEDCFSLETMIQNYDAFYTKVFANAKNNES